MFIIYLRVFPVNRRASFASRELTFNINNPSVSDISKYYPDIDITKYNVSRGTSFISSNTALVRNETLNLIPL
jgi:hypothetical protein